MVKSVLDTVMECMCIAQVFSQRQIWSVFLYYIN